MNNISFGQYYPTDSVLHRLDARLKLLVTIAYIVVIFMVKSYVGYAFTLIFMLAMAALGKIPLRVLFRTIRGIVLLIVFTSFINLFFTDGSVLVFKLGFIKIYKEGIISATKLVFRLILLMLEPSLLTLTTTPMELTDAIESLMYPLKKIKFPVHDIAVIMSIALRMIPTLMEETNKIMLAQKARGADFETGNIFRKAKAMIPILVPLFVGAFRRADELALALDARCYNATPNRTKYKVARFKIADLIAAFVVSAVFSLLLLEKYLWGIDSMIALLFC